MSQGVCVRWHAEERSGGAWHQSHTLDPPQVPGHPHTRNANTRSPPSIRSPCVCAPLEATVPSHTTTPLRHTPPHPPNQPHQPQVNPQPHLAYSQRRLQSCVERPGWGVAPCAVGGSLGRSPGPSRISQLVWLLRGQGGSPLAGGPGKARSIGGGLTPDASLPLPPSSPPPREGGLVAPPPGQRGCWGMGAGPRFRPLVSVPGRALCTSRGALGWERGPVRGGGPCEVRGL